MPDISIEKTGTQEHPSSELFKEAETQPFAELVSRLSDLVREVEKMHPGKQTTSGSAQMGMPGRHFSVLDLKAYYRGFKYATELIKMLPQKLDAIFVVQLFRKIATFGGIHMFKSPVSPA